MLWRLSGPVRCLSAHRSYSVAATAPEPLRILFCGSGNFSIASLRALDEARKNTPGLIESIDVVHRAPKRVGRGLKTLREVPVRSYATDTLKLPTHAIDTFTGWTPPVPINLIIAVSFGLFVPPRILGLAKYGGLNVHPSLLPDLRGPAPIQHAILKRRKRTGVSIQTLHPKHFDQGTVLAQTAEPWADIARDDIVFNHLMQQLATAGAKMLVDVLRAQLHIPPHKDAGWYASSGGPIDHAPRITKQDAFVNFAEKPLDDILAMHRALGQTWCRLPSGDRLVMDKLAAANSVWWDAPGRADEYKQDPGIFAVQGVDQLLFRAACGKIGIVESSTYAGSPGGHGNAKVKSMLAKAQTQEDTPP